MTVDLLLGKTRGRIGQCKSEWDAMWTPFPVKGAQVLMLAGL